MTQITFVSNKSKRNSRNSCPFLEIVSLSLSLDAGAGAQDMFTVLALGLGAGLKDWTLGTFIIIKESTMLVSMLMTTHT